MKRELPDGLLSQQWHMDVRKSKDEPESPGVGERGRRVEVEQNCTALGDLA